LRSRAENLIAVAKNLGYTLLVTQGFRSFQEQDAIFNQWRDGKDNDGDGRIDESDERVTHAAGGQSNHNYGLAVDFAFIVNGKAVYKPDQLFTYLGSWAKTGGLAWGGNWKHPDRPHVEMPNLPNWRDLLKLYKSDGLEAVWKRYA
jgi:peptidoglycan L-alanyl-D-glutamate endopeptidase CwlK